MGSMSAVASRCACRREARARGVRRALIARRGRAAGGASRAHLRRPAALPALEPPLIAHKLPTLGARAVVA